MIAQSNNHEYAQAARFLSILSNNSHEFTFQTFSDTDELKEDKRLVRTIHGSLDQHWSELVKLNNLGAGVFVTVQPTDLLGRKEKNIWGIRAFFCDHDNVLPSLYHLDPSIIVGTSGNKGHSYWLLEEIEPVNKIKFVEVQEILINHYQSDKACKDLARVLRLPGTFHMKEEPQLVKILSQSGQRYTREEILNGLSPLPNLNLNQNKIVSLSNSQDKKYFENILKKAISELENSVDGNRNVTLNKWVYTLAGIAGELNNPNLLDIISQKLFQIAQSIGLEKAEIETTIKSAIDAGFSNPLVSNKLQVGARDTNKSKRTKMELMTEAVQKLNLEWDVMTEEIMIGGENISLNELWQKLCLKYREDFAFEPLIRLIETEAQKNPINRVQEYLNKLSINYNPEITLSNLYIAMGVDNELHRLFIRKWLIGAVARIMKPGCQMDTALILYSQKQGLYKTSFFRELFNGYFQTLGYHKSEVDELLALYRKWCAEHGEIEYAINQKDVSRLKAFLTQTEDTFRSPYERRSITRKRTFVVCGTTNKLHFLNDPTGNRRFWVVTIERKIDINFISVNRDEIWGAILSLYNSGEEWYLDDVNDQLAREEAEEHQLEHPWVEKISNYLQHHNPCTLSDIMENALKIETNKLNNKKDQNEVASILTSLGCMKKRITKGDKKPYYWYLTE
jgi:predicted P-loop ATPase